MKNILKILFIVALIFSSCERKYSVAEFEFSEIKVDETEYSVNVVGKKGYAGTIKEGNEYNQWDQRLLKLKPHWYYTWANNTSEFSPDNVEFVPMQWGKWNLDPDDIVKLKALNNGKHHYFLGYNEPDGVEQANMTVDLAIELWPLLESIGLPLGSPAVVGNSATSPWMIDFMQKADEKGLRIDFMAVHWYGGASASSLISRLHEIHDAYGLPIWITEFAPADWDAITVEDNKHSPEKVLTFMEEILPQLEALDFVKRYAWFSFDQTHPAGTSSALFDEDNNLTPLGEFYANFGSNDKIGSIKR